MPTLRRDNITIPDDTILCELTSSAYAEDMPIPPSNQAQGLTKGRKRRFLRIAKPDSTKLEDEVEALRKEVIAAKKRKALLSEKSSLKKQLAKLKR